MKKYTITVYDGNEVESSMTLTTKNEREKKLIKHLQSETYFHNEYGYKDFTLWQLDGILTALYFADIADDILTGLFTVRDLKIEVKEAE